MKILVTGAAGALGRNLVENLKAIRDGKDNEVEEYEVSGDHIQGVWMKPGWTHNIINLSDTEDLVTVMWASEIVNFRNFYT